MKTALVETQDKMMVAFAAFALALFFAMVGGVCAVVAYQYGSYGHSLIALLICVLMAPVVWWQGKRFKRYGDEAERLETQAGADRW